MDTRDNEGGRSDAINAQGATDSLDQDSLACTERAVEKDEISCLTLLADAYAKCVHLISGGNLHS
jgi:hypothetical protein